MSNKVYVFSVGGTGLRIMKSVMMLLAAGMDAKGFEVVPIIVDPHIDLSERTRLSNLVDEYINIFNRTTIGEKNTENPLDGFFKTKVTWWKDLNGQMNDTSSDRGIRKSFGEYLNVGNLESNDINQYLIQTLFSEKNLDNSISVGFKGNPNVGTVVLGDEIRGGDWFNALKNSFNDGDRIFIISSIFGGTGASGYPLLEKLVRECDGYPNIQKCPMAAITVFPYFALDDPSLTNSSIDSTNFITKTKSALSYYENHVLSDYLYYIGEVNPKAVYKNNEEEQEDYTHFIEVVAATALFDFLGRGKPDNGTQYMSRAIKENVDSLDLLSLGDAYKDLVKAITDMKLLHTLATFIENENHFPLRKTHHKLDKDFYKDRSFTDLIRFLDRFDKWYSELVRNNRSFSPLNEGYLENGQSDMVKGITLDADGKEYYILQLLNEAIGDSGQKHQIKLRYLLDYAYKAINHYTKKILK